MVHSVSTGKRPAGMDIASMDPSVSKRLAPMGKHIPIATALLPTKTELSTRVGSVSTKQHPSAPLRNNNQRLLSFVSTMGCAKKTSTRAVSAMNPTLVFPVSSESQIQPHRWKPLPPRLLPPQGTEFRPYRVHPTAPSRRRPSHNRRPRLYSRQHTTQQTMTLTMPRAQQLVRTMVCAAKVPRTLDRSSKLPMMSVI